MVIIMIKYKNKKLNLAKSIYLYNSKNIEKKKKHSVLLLKNATGSVCARDQLDITTT